MSKNPGWFRTVVYSTDAFIWVPVISGNLARFWEAYEAAMDIWNLTPEDSVILQILTDPNSSPEERARRAALYDHMRVNKKLGKPRYPKR